MLLAALMAAFACATNGSARADASDKQAYEAATKCYVVAGKAYSDRKAAGDTPKAEAYDKKARAAFDLAVKFGRASGQNGSNIEADILQTQERELPKLVRDTDYYRQSAATCRALGLL